MGRSPLRDAEVVKRAYARQASFYDFTFGAVSIIGRKHAVREINKTSGRVLEVGVGTGIALPYYNKNLEVTGIDLSPDMLAKARVRKQKLNLSHVKELREMSAEELAFPDSHFDSIVAMYLITVVPRPEKVMRELIRACKPGGQIILVNHFSHEKGLRSWVEHKMEPLAATIGWRPVFPIERVMGFEGLTLKEKRAVKPAGIFTLLKFEKESVEAAPRLEAAE